MADGIVVEGEQFIHALEGGGVIGMPEPVELVQRGIDFDGSPAQESVAIDYVPVFVLDFAGLVTGPARMQVDAASPHDTHRCQEPRGRKARGVDDDVVVHRAPVAQDDAGRSDRSNSPRLQGDIGGLQRVRVDAIVDDHPFGPEGVAREYLRP